MGPPTDSGPSGSARVLNGQSTPGQGYYLVRQFSAYIGKCTFLRTISILVVIFLQAFLSLGKDTGAP
ncbi:unnamed protein product [Staurois parvus]|uniref:Uncharacterized protein n=1 Tax=Staurois parvus TaxID=386267 RepID=A0ABN9FNJ4_9NEOB|nr:unnamed protein product [Staurois parvus]